MPRSRKSRWKLWAILAGALVVTFLSVGIWLKFHPPPDIKVAPPPTSPLAGFTIMGLPRSTVDVGALWTQGIGPTQGSSGVTRLQTRSLTSSEISTVQNVDVSIVANMMRLFGAGASGSSAVSSDVKLTGLSIVTVGDASKLRSAAGNMYLWEAVRADQFTMTTSQADAASAHLKIKDTTSADKIEERVTGNGSVDLNVAGSKLYVAYRVVKISQPQISLVDLTTVSDTTAEVELGSEYVLDFAPSLKGETSFTKGCAVNVAVKSMMVRDAKGNPTQSGFKIACGAHPEETHPIGSTTGSLRATFDSLQMKNMTVSPREGGKVQVSGTFSIERSTMQLEALEKPSAAGW
jgi:hypothetical protein